MRLTRIIGIFVICTIFVILPYNTYAQHKMSYSGKVVTGSIAAGYSRIKNCELGSSTSGQIMFSLALWSFYVDFSFSPVGTGESVYGSGGVSDRHRVFNVDIGYLYPIYKNKIFLSPIIGNCNNATLLNDRYYGSDVYDSCNSFDYGGLVCIRFSNYFGLYGKVTNHQIGVTIGLVMHSDD